MQHVPASSLSEKETLDADFQDKRGFEADIYKGIRENQRAKRPRPIWLSVASPTGC